MTAIWSAVKRQSQGSLTSAIRSGQHSRKLVHWLCTGVPLENLLRTPGGAVTVRYSSQYSMGS